jgi:hypothetical protein
MIAGSGLGDRPIVLEYPEGVKDRRNFPI